MGGYFIINGNERIIRMLVMPRRNYVSWHVNSHCPVTVAVAKVQQHILRCMFSRPRYYLSPSMKLYRKMSLLLSVLLEVHSMSNNPNGNKWVFPGIAWYYGDSVYHTNHWFHCTFRYSTSGVAKVGHIGVRTPATRGCVPPTSASVPVHSVYIFGYIVSLLMYAYCSPWR